MAPIAQRIQIAEINLLLKTKLDARQSARNLSRDKRFAANGRFMIEENAVTGEQAVGFAIIHRNPVCVELGHCIR